MNINNSINLTTLNRLKGKPTTQATQSSTATQAVNSFQAKPLTPFNGLKEENLKNIFGNLTNQLQKKSARHNGTNESSGTSGDDKLKGTKNNDRIRGLGGNDVIKGRGGDDRLFGNDGNDQLYGNNGNDMLEGGGGNDRLSGGKGSDWLYGGNGEDLLKGDNGSDELNGGNGNDKLYGGSGSDRVFGNGGDDYLSGGSGNDVLSDNQGNNTIDGGRGRDELRFSGRLDDYNIMLYGNKFVFEHKVTGNTNTVQNVERFAFRDQGLSLSTLKQTYIGQKQTRYHSMDGSFNNLKNPDIGKANSPFRSLVPKDKSRSMDGSQYEGLPNPRDISNAVFAQGENTENAKGLSDMFWLWGQFLDHDITLTPVTRDESANIPIPAGDQYFDPQGTGDKTMPFHRSVSIVDDNGARTQTNHITAYLDGSNVYGSSPEEMDALRTYEGGQLLMDDDNRLPKNAEGHYIAGDERVNENVGLTSMHTIWAREHNRIADELAVENPSWKDEKLFQEARKQVVGEMQAITANEFLPAIFGGDGLSTYLGYNADVSPQLTNEFSTAAYRFGHTMLSPVILRLDENGNEIDEGNLRLRDAFFRPDKVAEAGVDPILRGFAAHTAQAADSLLVDDVRNFLFGPPGAGGFDLATLNIQRGRDHAVAGYNDVREALGLSRISSFDDPIFRGETGQQLASVYSSPDQVDLWVGGLAENAEGDGLFGSTFTAILRDQFERTRDGDRFWYENRFSGEELAELNSLKLSDVIKRNTSVENIQDDVFYASNNFDMAAADTDISKAANEPLSAESQTGIVGVDGVRSLESVDSESIAGIASIASDTVQVDASEANEIIQTALEVADAEEALAEGRDTTENDPQDTIGD